MAIIGKVNTPAGEDRELYIRVITVTTPNNQPDGTLSVPAVALFRGFASEDAFKAGGRYLWERELEFSPKFKADIRKEAYAALRDLPEFSKATDA